MRSALTRKSLYRMTAVTALAVTVVTSAACGSAAKTGAAGYSIEATDSGFKSPDTLTAGWIDATVKNTGTAEHDAMFVRLNDGVTMQQFQDALQQGGPQAAIPLVSFAGGTNTVEPGKSGEVYLNLKAGNYALLSMAAGADQVPDTSKGLIKPVVVKESNGTITAPHADVTVMMHDFAYDMPDSFKAGKTTIRVMNHGPQPHEMAIMKLHDGKTVDDVIAFMQSMDPATGQPSGEPPVDQVGGFQAVSSGAEGIVSLDLTPGSYIAACFIPDPATGKPHIELGMLKQFTVK